MPDLLNLLRSNAVDGAEKLMLKQIDDLLQEIESKETTGPLKLNKVSVVIKELFSLDQHLDLTV